jgi:hypothetical protein
LEKNSLRRRMVTGILLMLLLASIAISSPANTTYDTADISLTFTTDEQAVLITYSLDGHANVTTTGNTTLTGLGEGMHSLIGYAQDTAGNTGASDTMYFTIDIEEAAPFPTWILAIIGMIALGSGAALVYLMKFKKKPT